MPTVQKKIVPKAHLVSSHRKRKTPVTFSVDIGGSGIKATLLNGDGTLVKKRLRIPTPEIANPDIIIKQLEQLSKQLGTFDRIAVGFPGVVRNGVKEWKGYDFAQALEDKFSKPVRVLNDADMHGFGAISGKGVELVLTLGTGAGTALFVDGTLVPNIEAGAARIDGKALNKVGRKRWNKRLAKHIRKLEALFNYDRLLIGGGNAKHVDIQNLSGNVTICSNLSSLLGGARVWGH